MPIRCLICGSKQTAIIYSRLYKPSEYVGLKEKYNLSIIVCKICGYLGQKNRISADDLFKRYQLYAFNALSDSSDNKAFWEEKKNKDISRYDMISGFIKLNCRILDIGCGDGSLLSIFKKNGHRVNGVELNKQMIELCKNKWIPILDFDITKNQNKSIGKFDLIIMSHFLEHADNPIKCIKNATNLLSSSGILYIEVPNEEFLGGNNNYSIEHISYFFQPTLNYLFQKFHMRVLSQDKVSYATTPSSIRTVLEKRGKCLNRNFLKRYITKIEYVEKQFLSSIKIFGEKLKGKKIAFFGAGEYAVVILENRLINPIVIFDNNKNKIAKKVNGIIIDSFENYNNYDFDTIVITSWASGHIIKEQINANMKNVNNVNIFLIKDLVKI